MSGAPALLIFKDYGEEFLKLSQEEAGELLQAIASYAIGKQPDKKKMSRVVEILFSLIEKDSVRNEERYQQQKDYNKNYQREYRTRKQLTRTKTAKAEQKKQHQDEETPKKKATAEKTANKTKLEHNQNKKEFTQEQQNFINRFKDLCPEKSVDCDVNDFP